MNKELSIEQAYKAIQVNYVQIFLILLLTLNNTAGYADTLNSEVCSFYFYGDTVQLDDGRCMALRVENLEMQQSAGPGMQMPNIPGVDPAMMAQAQQYLQTLLQILPVGVSIQQVSLALMGSAALLLYTVGFMRMLIFLGTLCAVLFKCLPAFNRAGGGLKGAKAASSFLSLSTLYE